MRHTFATIAAVATGIGLTAVVTLAQKPDASVDQSPSQWQGAPPPTQQQTPPPVQQQGPPPQGQGGRGRAMQGGAGPGGPGGPGQGVRGLGPAGAGNDQNVGRGMGGRGRGMGPGRGMGMGPGAGPGGRGLGDVGLGPAIRQLDLTADQRTAFETLERAARDQSGAIDSELAFTRTSLHRELFADKRDAARVTALTTKISALEKQLFDIRVKNQAAVADLLTPAQRETVRIGK